MTSQSSATSLPFYRPVLVRGGTRHQPNTRSFTALLQDTAISGAMIADVKKIAAGMTPDKDISQHMPKGPIKGSGTALAKVTTTEDEPSEKLPGGSHSLRSTVEEFAPPPSASSAPMASDKEHLPGTGAGVSKTSEATLAKAAMAGEPSGKPSGSPSKKSPLRFSAKEFVPPPSAPFPPMTSDKEHMAGVTKTSETLAKAAAIGEPSEKTTADNSPKKSSLRSAAKEFVPTPRVSFSHIKKEDSKEIAASEGDDASSSSGSKQSSAGASKKAFGEDIASSSSSSSSSSKPIIDTPKRPSAVSFPKGGKETMNAKWRLLRAERLELMHIIQHQPRNYAEWVEYRNQLPEDLAIALIQRDSVIRPFQRARLFVSLMNKLTGGDITPLIALRESLTDTLEKFENQYPHIKPTLKLALAPIPRPPDPHFVCVSDEQMGRKRTVEPIDYEEAIISSACAVEHVYTILEERTTSYQLSKEKICKIFYWDTKKAFILTKHILGVELTDPKEALSHSVLKEKLIALIENVLDLEDQFCSYVIMAKQLHAENSAEIVDEMIALYHMIHKEKLRFFNLAF